MRAREKEGKERREEGGDLVSSGYVSWREGGGVLIVICQGKLC